MNITLYLHGPLKKKTRKRINRLLADGFIITVSRRGLK